MFLMQSRVTQLVLIISLTSNCVDDVALLAEVFDLLASVRV